MSPRETKSSFKRWFTRKAAAAIRWVTPRLELELNKFAMEATVQVGFNADYLTFKLTSAPKV